MRFSSSLFFFVVFCFLQSCKDKCYDCTRICGYCTKGVSVLFGCDGDSALGGYSAESWKVFLESQGYVCQYNNLIENNVCDKSDKKTLEENHYTCKKK
jgi:hypothetical protein